MKNGLIQNKSEEFALEIIKLSGKLPKSSIGFVLANQLMRSGTSVGANIMEAQDASTKKDFCRSMNIGLKEARETQYWLKLILKAKILPREKLEKLISENQSIINILISILKTARNKD